MGRQWNKVFELGSEKTGTTSLGKAYEILGLRQPGFSQGLETQFMQGNMDLILQAAEQFDAFQDKPWHSLDPALLDGRFPGSKFILLERNLDDWIRSYENHYSAEKNLNKIPAQHLIHDFQSRKAQIIKAHLDRYEAIKTYFKDRPDDLLVFSLCDGEGWERLCPFLELPVPEVDFPFLYKTPRSRMDLIRKLSARFYHSSGRRVKELLTH